jgi:hypothetical protein
MMFRAVFWVIHFTRQYNPEDSSEQYLLFLECLRGKFRGLFQSLKKFIFTENVK